MSVIRQLLKIAGKEKFELDSRIGIGYITGQCWKYGWMMIRGKIFSLFNPNISNSIFIGSKVHVIEKRNLRINKNCKLHSGVYIDALSTDGVEIGSGVILGRNTRLECTGGLRKIGKGITIGSSSTFGDNCFFGAAGGIEIGENVIAGQYIRFHSENHCFNDLELLIKEQGVTHQGIKIGSNCWIGSGAVFLDGVELGDGCVVAANTVVTRSFSNNSVIGGIPGKVLKKRGD